MEGEVRAGAHGGREVIDEGDGVGDECTVGGDHVVGLDLRDRHAVDERGEDTLACLHACGQDLGSGERREEGVSKRGCTRTPYRPQFECVEGTPFITAENTCWPACTPVDMSGGKEERWGGGREEGGKHRYVLRERFKCTLLMKAVNTRWPACNPEDRNGGVEEGGEGGKALKKWVSSLFLCS